MYEFLKRLKAGTEDETNGRHLLPQLIVSLCEKFDKPHLLDVGAGYGPDILAAARALPSSSVKAVERYPNAVKFLRENGVEVVILDIERERLPFDDNTFNVVICNQVIEHVKELFWLISELSRVCKVEGHLILGTPNLGSLHNRVALLLGLQPPAIHVFGPHVRGFTVDGLCDFLHRGDMLHVERVLGGNFYPFPRSVSRPLARWLPGLAVSSFYVVRKTRVGNFLDIFQTPQADELVHTPYFRGEH